MGTLVRSHDWSATELGPIETWPQSLLTAVDVCLNSRFPMVVFWGPSLITLYNDGYRPSFGTKHPRVLGAPAETLWPEAWHLLGPMMRQVVESGVPTWSEDQFLLVDRKGFSEETYWTFSYSPIRGDLGSVDGVFTAVTETTTRVLGERRLRTLRELGSEVLRARDVPDTVRMTAEVLSKNPRDLPVALIYLGDEERLLLGAATPGAVERFSAPAEVTRASGEGLFGAVLFRVLQGSCATVEEPGEPQATRGGGEGGALPRRVLVLPIVSQGQGSAAGVLVVGLNPHLELDESYRGFLSLAAGQLATAISRVKAHDEERRRAEALAEIDRVKTAFFSNVSHEFRTPLTLMLGPAEDALADGDNPLPPVHRERLELVHRGALRLLKLVNTLLDFSRIEAGRIQATYVPTELASFTADLASTFRSAIEKAGVRLTVACRPLPEAVWVDREMWEKIVLNLLSNAFKFTSQGEIAVAVRAEGGRAELSVRDTGTGIPQEELPRIFERFHRVKGAQGRSYEGSGIGLSLVRELVRLHGGEVRVESALGRGTVFTVSVPFGKAHLPQERLAEASGPAPATIGAAAYAEEARGWLAQAIGSELALTAPPAVQARPSGTSAVSPGYVLLADDNADMREYVRRLLQGRYAVQAVENGLRALEAARARPPELVLSDVMMPGLDGFGLLRELRADARTAQVPVILLSARAGEEAKIEGLEAGATDYLVKPFGARELLARVEGALRLGREHAIQARLQRERADFEQHLIGIVSHDLRNPIGAILLGATGLLRKGDLSERQAKSVGRIHSAAERAHRMIRDLLDFTEARLAGAIRIERRATELHEILNAVLEEVAATHPGREVQWSRCTDCQGEWDPDRLAQLVQNLLTNALKYSPDGTPVRIETRADEDSVIVSVHNEGTPIPAERLERIFQPLQRATGEVDVTGRSIGLGLYIVKQVVDAHGGAVAVQSTAQAGTTFTVRLPRKAPPPTRKA
ncbi:MAG TPA: ATP-binding protein [Myxococcaceae bacterium]|nr:ATP-binding protein [Myxococcaceae bacterium]